MKKDLLIILGVFGIGYWLYTRAQASTSPGIALLNAPASNTAVSNTQLPLLRTLPIMEQPVPADVSALPEYKFAGFLGFR